MQKGHGPSSMPSSSDDSPHPSHNGSASACSAAESCVRPVACHQAKQATTRLSATPSQCRPAKIPTTTPPDRSPRSPARRHRQGQPGRQLLQRSPVHTPDAGGRGPRRRPPPAGLPAWSGCRARQQSMALASRRRLPRSTAASAHRVDRLPLTSTTNRRSPLVITRSNSPHRQIQFRSS